MTLSESRSTSGRNDRGFAAPLESAFERRPRVRVGGVEFATTSLTEATDELIAAATARPRRGIAVRLANAFSVSLASQDPIYRGLLNGPGVTLPDGAPAGWIVRRKTRRSVVRGGRVRGPSFFVEVLDRGRRAGVRHYFLGACRETLDALTDELDRRLPGVALAGTWAPPFAPLDVAFYDEAIARVEAARPDVLWLGLGTPKQDQAAAVLAARLGIPVVGVGAAFDFFAGTVREAPPFFRDHGLEWLFRLATEPRRLWRRYLIGNVRFVVAVLVDEFRPPRLHRG